MTSSAASGVTRARQLPDPCLWVRDAKSQGRRDPEALRCRSGAAFTCKPCWSKFYGQEAGA